MMRISNTRLLLALAASIPALLSGSQAIAADAPPSTLTVPDHYGTWGFDIQGRDTGVKPGNDFFTYANGIAVKNIVIPPDQTAYGPFQQLRELSRVRVRQIFASLPKTTIQTPQTEQDKLAVFYTTFMDEAAVNAAGAKPLEQGLAAIHAVNSAEDFAKLVGTSQYNFQFPPFSLMIQPDAKDPTKFAINLDQGGLGLPDRDYYSKPEFAAKKTAYQAYITKMLTLIGWPDAAARAADIVAFEADIAKAHWARADLRDPTRTYNPMSVAQLEKAAPGFGWKTWLQSAGIPDAIIASQQLIVGEPSAITGEAAVLGKTSIPVLQAWLAFHLANNSADDLSSPFVQASYEFNDKMLAGQPELAARWKRGVSAASSAMGWAIGHIYVDRYFPPESREKMGALTQELKAAFRIRLAHNSWMSAQTRARATRKLDAFTIQIGFPKKWRDYGSLDIHAGDAYGNAERAIAFEWKYWLAHLGRPVDRDEWDMTPQTVNAYNNPVFNEVVFPAAILQPPFFDPKADPAINYGAIGGVIGHEMTHGFDDEGRKFDEKGRLRDWWTKDDAARFEKLAARLGAQYDAFEVLPGVHLNGKLTMGENIADLGGLTLALDAYHASLGGKPAPVIDGLTGDQRVFLGWAQVWREKMRADRVRQLAVIDPHSAPEARVNLPMHNIDAWYDAWSVQSGEKLYLKPQDRVKIW